MAGQYTIRLGVDMSMGHGSYPPQVTVQGSTTCFANYLGQARQTDKYTGHAGSGSFHPALALGGSRTVFYENLGMHRNADKISCGDMAGNGSQDVFGG